MKRHSRGQRGRASIGDAIGEEILKRLLKLKRELEEKARKAVSAQLQVNKAPWIADPRLQKRSAPRVLFPTKPSQGMSRKAIRSPMEPKVSPASLKGPLVFGKTRTAKPVPPLAERREEKRIEFWPMPATAAVREESPRTIDPAARQEFETVCSAGEAENGSGQGEALFAYIGLDFGTSSTKVVVRFYYEDEKLCYAVPAPRHCLSDNDKYLWQTVCWLRPKDGMLLAWPEIGALEIKSLKQGIVGGSGAEKAVEAPNGQSSVTREEAAIGYLAYVIRYAKGWMMLNHPELFRKRKPIWFVNVGLPATHHDTPRISQRYRGVVAAAFALANSSLPVSNLAIEAILQEPQIQSAIASLEGAENLGISITPEVAAEIAGFAKSTNRADGLYLMVDVGAMTLDVCAFNLVSRAEDGDRYSLLATEIRPLGADALPWFEKEGKTKEGFREQCDWALRIPIWLTRRKRDPNSRAFSPDQSLPVFTAGGGAKNGLHKDCIKGLDFWLKEYVRNMGVNIQSLPVPDILRRQGFQSVDRIAVAFGLSYPPNELAEVVKPTQIEDLEGLNIIDYEARFPGADTHT